jgi:hypothetical protein
LPRHEPRYGQRSPGRRRRRAAAASRSEQHERPVVQGIELDSPGRPYVAAGLSLAKGIGDRRSSSRRLGTSPLLEPQRRCRWRSETTSHSQQSRVCRWACSRSSHPPRPFGASGIGCPFARRGVRTAARETRPSRARRPGSHPRSSKEDSAASTCGLDAVGNQLPRRQLFSRDLRVVSGCLVGGVLVLVMAAEPHSGLRPRAGREPSDASPSSRPSGALSSSG